MSRAVIDQPGIRITIFGLILSFFLGYALKTQISDSRVELYLNKAVSRLQSDFTIDYEKARVNLSKWGLPFPVLEVSHIRLSPKGNCSTSQIFVDELEVPIAFSVLLGLTTKVPKVRLRNMELRVSEIENCYKPTTQTKFEGSTSSPPENQKQNSASEIKEVFNRNTKAELSDIYLEKLKIIFANKPEQPLVLKNVNIELKYAVNKLSEISVKSKFNAIKDPISDLYFINANLTLLAKAEKEGLIDSVLKIDGKLLDGDVQFFTHYQTGDTKLNYELVLDKVSARALQPLSAFEASNKISLFEKIPVSVSFKNSGEIFLVGKPHVNSIFKRVIFNAENAQIKSNELNLSYEDSKLKVLPFDFLIDSLPLTKLKNTEFFKGKADSFESLGVVSGKLSYLNENNLKFDGILRGLEVVFSNRGRRDFQNIDEMNFHLRRTKNNYSFEAHSVVVGGEKLEGIFTINHDADQNSTQAALKLSGVIFNKKVWDQFTFIEQAPNVEVNWNYKKATSEEYSLKMHADSLEVPGILFTNLNLDLNQSEDLTDGKSYLNLNIRPQKILTSEKFIENEFVSEVFKSSVGLKGQSYTSDKTTINFNGRDWKSLSFAVDSTLLEVQQKNNLHFSIKGTVDPQEGVKSKLLLMQKNQAYKYDFRGTPTGKLTITPEL